jgi:hypothetical protein
VTEAEWLSCTEPRRMLDYVEVYHRVARTRKGRRKLRLFACACCRRLWHLPGKEYGKQVIEIFERFAEGLAEWDDVLGAIEAEKAVMATLEPGWCKSWWETRLWEASQLAARYRPQDATNKYSLFRYGHLGENRDDGPRVLCCLIRDLFGNPFRPSPPLPPALLAWNDNTISRMAQAIYDDRSFDRLPILADALEEAGCNDPDILGHCRSSGEHARGCWVIDALLGKS